MWLGTPTGVQTSGCKLFVGCVTPRALKGDFWAAMENDALMWQDVIGNVWGVALPQQAQSRRQCAYTTVGSVHHGMAA